ncbi:MAG: hypothetical protein EP343_16090 [Deltaproteobacteria bacterium]|nr:MAG: hypothetical protein EP343_16090 [Deltaproteobacteria bacterium]
MFWWLQPKSEIPASDLVDIHNHSLPNIDDGASSVEASLNMYRDFANCGYSDVAVSCHLGHPRFPEVSGAKIRESVAMMQEHLDNEGIALKLHPGSEIWCDDRFEQRWEAGELLPVGGDGPYLLIEFALRDPMLRMKDLAFSMTTQGIRPILAHPERYDVLLRKPELIHEWKESGWSMQLDLCSLLLNGVGSVRKLARTYLKQNVFDLGATDLHGPTGKIGKMLELLSREVDTDEMTRLLVTNPQRILRGEYLIQLDPED